MSDKIVDEHFWFTATTLAVNAFLISTEALSKPLLIVIGKILCSFVVSAYAVFLVVHRAAVYAGRHLGDEVAGSAHDPKLKWKESKRRLRRFGRDLKFVVVELSGAFFYLMLIVMSFFGVIVTALLQTEPK